MSSGTADSCNTQKITFTDTSLSADYDDVTDCKIELTIPATKTFSFIDNKKTQTTKITGYEAAALTMEITLKEGSGDLVVVDAAIATIAEGLTFEGDVNIELTAITSITKLALKCPLGLEVAEVSVDGVTVSDSGSIYVKENQKLTVKNMIFGSYFDLSLIGDDGKIILDNATFEKDYKAYGFSVSADTKIAGLTLTKNCVQFD